MSGKQKKLVRADITISHFRPTTGNKIAPEKLLAVSAKLLMLHKSANDVASKPVTLLRAIKSRIIIKINIPKKL